MWRYPVAAYRPARSTTRTLRVNKETKIELHRSRGGSMTRPNRDQTEQVPLACDTEIYRVTPVGSPSCTCQDP